MTRLDRKFASKGGNNGYLNPPALRIEDDIHQRVAGHIKNYNREKSQNVWIEKMANLHPDITLCLVILPVRSDYREGCFNAGFSGDKVSQMAKRLNMQCLNFFDDTDFTDEDFYDFDHLNPSGAIKFSKKLRHYVND